MLPQIDSSAFGTELEELLLISRKKQKLKFQNNSLVS